MRLYTNTARINILFYYKSIIKITNIIVETHKHRKSLIIETLTITLGIVNWIIRYPVYIFLFSKFLIMKIILQSRKMSNTLSENTIWKF